MATDTASNPLGAGSLASLMAASLPKGQTPQLKNPYDAIALAVHAGMAAVGFKLIGLGEDHRIDTPTDAGSPQVLPTEWNSASSYAFRYTHPQSSMEYVIKINRLGGKAVVFGIAVGDDKPVNFDLTVKDYVSESSVPITPAGSEASTEEAVRALKEIFISANRLNDLGSHLKTSIIQRLAPGIHKEGYEESRARETRSDHSAREQPREPRPQAPTEPEPARPYPFNDPLAVHPQPGRPLPEPIPGFEDEYEINRPPRGFHPGANPQFPNIGRDDLYPPGLGPHDPIRPHFGGALPQPGGAPGGMHPTFDDPLFGGQAGVGQGYDPMAPPGSRFDPVEPGGALRDGRGGTGPRFPGRGGGFGGAPPNPFGGFGSGDFI